MPQKLNEMSPLVSIIVPTYNSSRTIQACLQSITQQTYPHIELIVVDNHSTDQTATIARKYSTHVYTKGPERNAQRNYGLAKAKGSYVVSIDSDMVLSKNLIASCVSEMQSDSQLVGLYIPEESFGVGFWAQCLKLERSFYVGKDWIEAARFFKKDILKRIHGFDESLISAEDWYLSEQVAKEGKLGRVKEFIYHDEGSPSLMRIVSKKYYYATKMHLYIEKRGSGEVTHQSGNVIKRYALFVSHPYQLLKNPLVGLGMLTMKTLEYAFGLIGYMKSKYFQSSQ